MKRWLTAAAVALLALALAAPAHSAVRRSPEFGQFYNPFPYYYQPELVKVFSGITPGTTTLGEILEKRGEPKRVVNNLYLYYEWVDYPQGRRDFQEVYLEFRESKRLGKKRYSDEGLDLTAVVSRIFVYSTYRMDRLATYLDQIADVTVYPYDVVYNRRDRFYTMVFPYQGYAMYFTGGSGRFVGEAYFEPELYEVRRRIRISVGSFNFERVEREELPAWLR